MVEIRGARRPVLAMGLGLAIATVGLWGSSHLGPSKGNPTKKCTGNECEVNFPGDRQGAVTTGVGSIVVFGVQVHMGLLEPKRVELGVGPKTLYAPMGFVREALGLEIELKRTAPDGAIVVFRKGTGARN